MLKKLKTAYPIFTQNFTYKYGVNLYIRTKMTNVLPWPVSKKPKLANETVVKDDADKNLEKAKIPRVKKRMFALMVAYCGQGYFGLQRNFGQKTIEEEIMIALKNIGVVNEEEFKRQQSIYFQRAARTDKGVSALRQIISLEMREDVKPEDINTHLPEQIRVLAVRRVTKGFNSKNSCDSRTYSYTCPTFAFAPKDTPISDDYRISPEILEKLNESVKSFIGTRNYHNFTSGRRSQDPSCKRFLIDIYYRPPFVREDLELITFIIKGQSFMLHQIRKMMGTLMIISAGYFPPDYILKAYDENEKLEIPIAPGVGLLLEQVHYDWYNNKYGQDGFHQRLDFVEIEPMVEEFREKYINPAIIKAEKEEKSMKNWLEDMRLRILEEQEINSLIKNVQQNESSDACEDSNEKTLNDETDKKQMENSEQNNTNSIIADGGVNDVQKSPTV